MRPGMTLGFPPFTKAVKVLIITYALLLLGMAFIANISQGANSAILLAFGLRPEAVAAGWLWQIVTYSFLHMGLFHLLANSLGMWMFGSQMEMDWGTTRFLEFFFFCVAGAAVITIFSAYAFQGFLPGMSPLTVTVGASGGVYGILLAFAWYHGEREIMLFPLPFLIKAKYVVMGLIFITVYGTLTGGSGISYIAHLGGLVFAWVYLKFVPRYGLATGASETYFGWRNAYYRWKRRRAARKFEVYMRKHDPEQYFDQYGNFRDPNARPDDKRDDDRGNGRWVN